MDPNLNLNSNSNLLTCEFCGSRLSNLNCNCQNFSYQNFKQPDLNLIASSSCYPNLNHVQPQAQLPLNLESQIKNEYQDQYQNNRNELQEQYGLQSQLQVKSEFQDQYANFQNFNSVPFSISDATYNPTKTLNSHSNQPIQNQVQNYCSLPMTRTFDQIIPQVPVHNQVIHQSQTDYSQLTQPDFQAPSFPNIDYQSIRQVNDLIYDPVDPNSISNTLSCPINNANMNLSMNINMNSNMNIPQGLNINMNMDNITNQDYTPMNPNLNDQEQLLKPNYNIISVQPESQISRNHSNLLNQKEFELYCNAHGNISPNLPISLNRINQNYAMTTTPTNRMALQFTRSDTDPNSDLDYRSRNTTPFDHSSTISPNFYPNQSYSPMVDKIQTPVILYNESIVSRDHTPLSSMTSPMSNSNQSSPLVNLNFNMSQIRDTDKLQPKVSIKRKRIHKGANCPICGKFISRDLSRHLRIHEMVGRFQCIFSKEQCKHKSGYFNRPYDFKKHLLHFHFQFDDPKVKTLNNLSDKLDVWGSCVCGERSKSGDWLEKHILTDDDALRCKLVVRREFPMESLDEK